MARFLTINIFLGDFQSGNIVTKIFEMPSMKFFYIAATAAHPTLNVFNFDSISLHKKKKKKLIV